MVRFAVMALVLAGCYSDPSGTLLVFKGTKKFDQVELFFGKNVRGPTPTTPQRPDLPPQERQQLVKRLFAHHPEDDAPPPARTSDTSYSFFIEAAGTENLALGDYMMVIATANGTPVGAGELFDFKLPVDEAAVYRYDVPLVDYSVDEVERWGAPMDIGGPGDDCVRWTRPRGTGPATIAVVRGEDHDCDSYPDDPNAARTDCQPLRYCDGTTIDPDCIGESLCLQDLNGVCASGSCINSLARPRSCARTTCVEDTLCGPCPSGSPMDLADCAFTPEGSGTHTDITLQLAGARTLCGHPTYNIPINLPIPCTLPNVDAHTNDVQPDLFAYRIDGGADSSVCILQITEPALNTPFKGAPHLVISVESPPGSPLPRTQFILGITVDISGCPATLMPLDVKENLDSCGP